MTSTSKTAQQRYADLIIRSGANVQEGQCVRLSAELAQRDLVQLLTVAAYDVGAKLVHVEWQDPILAKARLTHSRPDYLTFLPEYEVTRHQEMVDQAWARIALVGSEYPDIFQDVDPGAMRAQSVARAQKLKFYMQAMMANKAQWCVAAGPTKEWATKVFPDLDAESALARLWDVVLETCRANEEDPVTAWQQHGQRLKRVINFLHEKQVRSVHFVDFGADNGDLPLTDLVVGMTDFPVWVGAAAESTQGVPFLPNLPTEEIFSTPHNQRTNGYVRLTKPAFPFDREVSDATFWFEDGKVVRFEAQAGKEVLEEFFAIEGTERLGEVALVDVRSPVNQAGVIFYETLFDENAVCHIAFGEAYPEGIEGGNDMDEETLRQHGVNKADTHLDVMIGSSTMTVTGVCLDGSEVTIMQNGQFVDI